MFILFSLWEIIKSIALQSSQWHHPNFSWLPWRKSRIVCSRIMKQIRLQSSWGWEKKRIVKHTLPGALLFSTPPVLRGTQQGCPTVLDWTSGLQPHEVLKTEQKPVCRPQWLWRGLWGRGRPENLVTVKLAEPWGFWASFWMFLYREPGWRREGAAFWLRQWWVWWVCKGPESLQLGGCWGLVLSLTWMYPGFLQSCLVRGVRPLQWHKLPEKPDLRAISYRCLHQDTSSEFIHQPKEKKVFLP